MTNLQAHLKAPHADAQTKAFKRPCKEKIMQTMTQRFVHILTVLK